MTPPNPARPAALQSWMATHKAYVAMGGVGAVLGLIALKKKTATAPAAPGTVAGTAVPAGGYSSDPYSAATDAYNSLEPQLEALQNQIASVSSSASSPTAPASAPPPQPAAASYTRIPDEQTGSFDAASGQTIYADVNGQYVAVANGNQRLPNWNYLPKGSTLFTKNS